MSINLFEVQYTEGLHRYSFDLPDGRKLVVEDKGLLGRMDRGEDVIRIEGEEPTDLAFREYKLQVQEKIDEFRAGLPERLEEAAESLKYAGRGSGQAERCRMGDVEGFLYKSGGFSYSRSDLHTFDLDQDGHIDRVVLETTNDDDKPLSIEISALSLVENPYFEEIGRLYENQGNRTLPPDEERKFDLKIDAIEEKYPDAQYDRRGCYAVVGQEGSIRRELKPIDKIPAHTLAAHEIFAPYHWILYASLGTITAAGSFAGVYALANAGNDETGLVVSMVPLSFSVAASALVPYLISDLVLDQDYKTSELVLNTSMAIGLLGGTMASALLLTRVSSLDDSNFPEELKPAVDPNVITIGLLVAGGLGAIGFGWAALTYFQEEEGEKGPIAFNVGSTSDGSGVQVGIAGGF
ncbi:MAG: hypothetical protein Q7S00_01900 [bacterium]|nr:hypothetical protein [bacterium]